MQPPVLLLSGATSVLGREIVKIFARNRWNLGLMTYQNQASRDTLENYCADTLPRGSWLWHQGSLSDRREVEKFVDTIGEKLGQVQVLINNAGITINKPLVRLSDKEWDQVMDINLNGPFVLCRAVLKHMIKNNRGHLIHISSIQAYKGGAAPYAASKAALIGFSKSLALEYGKKTICSNVIFPGYMDSPLTNLNSQKFREEVIENSCLKQLNQPEQAAEFIYYLANLDHISGQVFNLDSRI
jgi:3-oxoacyl-[acyl-carrier protein] reductase